MALQIRLDNIIFVTISVLVATTSANGLLQRRQRQAVVDTVTTQDEIVGPDGISVPVARTTNTQVSPVAPNIPQVFDSVQTQDSVITPSGAQIPVASSSNIQRVARQFVNSMNPNPRLVDTVTVQDTVVDPVSGAAVPVGATSNTVVSPAVGPVAPVAPVPQVVDTVQTQDTIISPTGQEIPVSSSSQTQVSPVAAGQPQVFDTVTVQDSVVAPNGAMIPVSSSVQSRALPMFPAAVPANYGHFYPLPRTMNTMAVQDSVMAPNGLMVPVAGASQSYASPAGMPMQPYYPPRFYRREFHDKGHQHSETRHKTVDEDLRAILAPVRADSKNGDSSSSSQEKKKNSEKNLLKNDSESSNSSEPTLFSKNFTSKAQSKIHSSKSRSRNSSVVIQSCNGTTIHEPATTANNSKVFQNTQTLNGEKNNTGNSTVTPVISVASSNISFNTTDLPPNLNVTTTIVIEESAKVVVRGNSLQDEEFPVTAADLEHAAEKVVILPKSALIPNNETVFSDFVGNETLH